MSKDIWLLQPLTNPDQILLWMQIVFLWMFVNYLIVSDPAGKKANKEQSKAAVTSWKYKVLARSLGAAIASFFLLGISTDLYSRRLLISGVVAAFAIALPLIRLKLAVSDSEKASGLIAEWEALANVAFISMMGFLISIFNLHIKTEQVLFQVAVPPGRVAVIIAVASGLIFVVRGGTQIVRSILDKFEALPVLSTRSEAPSGSEETPAGRAEPSNDTVDTKEYNRGRMIGNLERILLLLVVLVGNYEALGFLVAGKGLIRAKEFENRNFAEYFLLGTFASTGMALILGLILSLMIKGLW